MPQALLQFDYTFPSTPEEEELFEKSKLPCHLNLAACKLQLRDFEEVYIQCRLVRLSVFVFLLISLFGLFFYCIISGFVQYAVVCKSAFLFNWRSSVCILQAAG